MKKIITFLIVMLVTNTTFAYEQLGNGGDERSRVWRKFAEKVYQLHEQQIANRAVRIKKENGGYKKYPNSYIDTSYYDEKSGVLLSHIKWRTDKPNQAHVMEVFVYDHHQRLVRDYTVAYVGFYYNHLNSGAGVPNQALVSFYNQHKTLKAFRTFDASGDFVYESCSGTLDGKPVEMAFEDDESGGIENTKEYKACFDGVPVSAGEYLEPH